MNKLLLTIIIIFLSIFAINQKDFFASILPVPEQEFLFSNTEFVTAGTHLSTHYQGTGTGSRSISVTPQTILIHTNSYSSNSVNQDNTCYTQTEDWSQAILTHNVPIQELSSVHIDFSSVNQNGGLMIVAITDGINTFELYRSNISDSDLVINRISFTSISVMSDNVPIHVIQPTILDPKKKWDLYIQSLSNSVGCFESDTSSSDITIKNITYTKVGQQYIPQPTIGQPSYFQVTDQGTLIIPTTSSTPINSDWTVETTTGTPNLLSENNGVTIDCNDKADDVTCTANIDFKAIVISEPSYLSFDYNSLLKTTTSVGVAKSSLSFGGVIISTYELGSSDDIKDNNENGRYILYINPQANTLTYSIDAGQSYTPTPITVDLSKSLSLSIYARADVGSNIISKTTVKDLTILPASVYQAVLPTSISLSDGVNVQILDQSTPSINTTNVTESDNVTTSLPTTLVSPEEGQTTVITISQEGSQNFISQTSNSITGLSSEQSVYGKVLTLYNNYAGEIIIIIVAGLIIIYLLFQDPTFNKFFKRRR